MATSPVPGATLFLGDSITVGLPPYVQVDGKKTKLAVGGKTSDWLLKNLRLLETAGGLEGAVKPVNAFMLIGTNDIGGGLSAEAIFSNIVSTWAILQHHGIRIFAQTVPPVKGYTGYASRYAAIDAKRKKLNTLITDAEVSLQAGGGRVIPLAQLVGDPLDPDKLAKAYDGGDHIHLRNDAHGSLLQAQAQVPPLAPPIPSPSPSPPPAPATPAVSVEVSLSSSLLPYLVVGGIVLGGTWVLARKRTGQSLLPSFHHLSFKR